MNDRRNYFMINLYERMLPTLAGVEPATFCSDAYPTEPPRPAKMRGGRGSLIYSAGRGLTFGGVAILLLLTLLYTINNKASRTGFYIKVFHHFTICS